MNLREPLSLVAMRIGWALLGIAAVLLVCWKYAAWIHDISEKPRTYYLGIERSGAFYPTAIDTGGYCRIVWWEQKVTDQP